MRFPVSGAPNKASLNGIAEQVIARHRAYHRDVRNVA